LYDERTPHDYQNESVEAWADAGYRGSIVLPTGAGKTFVAMRAIHRVNCATVVIAPTIDLLHQWYARLSATFDCEVGVYYGGEKVIEPLTVTTYHSAGDLIADHGNTFKLIIFDEVHHLPAPSWGETALMSPSPYRLGLTATYPREEEQTGERWQLADLIGPIVYQKRIDDLTGATLATYRTERIYVDLTPQEQEQYDADYAIYADFFRTRQLHKTHGAGWFMELMRLSAFEVPARRALLARQRILRLIGFAENKLASLDRLLRQHFFDQALIFTESNDVVYHLSRRYLIPAITHETKAAERKDVLSGYRQREYRAVVTSRVLNEGVDVPEAKIAIVLGGTSRPREYVQRLGRVLRKRGNKEALLYEVVVRNTVDAGRSRRRRPKGE
jgi:superfamily II DNA or RNA helicase